MLQFEGISEAGLKGYYSENVTMPFYNNLTQAGSGQDVFPLDFFDVKVASRTPEPGRIYGHTIFHSKNLNQSLKLLNVLNL